ncbi:MAG: tRNA preQ1(34) S-adenosylmethionine ribosyltransferase-isomerase QueA [Firmicutes bacterium]|nr:tRNA preQ1(34) S-adenosylmethionine ribosyltransferase-isomerase QueA [Bacillota bacterium]
MYRTDDYDYFLPEELIAQEPLEKRDQSRLLVLQKNSGEIKHKHFSDILEYLHHGDTLVINDTKVMPARLYGQRKNTGAKIEVLLLKQQQGNRWEALVKPGKRAKVGDVIIFSDGQQVIMEADIIGDTEAGGRILEFKYDGQFFELMDRLGTMPLPPYIKKELQDRERYQTVYAQKEGSAAAPTAGLHFTDELLSRLQDKGVKVARVLLHVGLGTFRPVKAEDIREHQMHQEYYEITPETAELINSTKEQGGRVVAVGTTSVRTLETVAGEDGKVKPGTGWTGIFIYPGYNFKCVDALATNFHLPKSTLLMLVSAFAGKDNVMTAYQQAVKEQYRFFSFGDAMLLI